MRRQLFSLILPLVMLVFAVVFIVTMLHYDKERAQANAAKLGGCISFSVLHRGYDVVPCTEK